MPNPTTNRGYILPNVGDPETEWPAEIQTAFDAIDRDMAIVSVTGTGFPARIAPDTWALRWLAVGEGLTIMNPDGVGGNPTVTQDVIWSAALTSGDATPITGTSLGIFDKTYTLPPGLLNLLGRRLRISFGGIYSSDVSPGACTVFLRVGGQNLIATQLPIGASAVNYGWTVFLEAMVHTPGSSGLMMASEALVGFAGASPQAAGGGFANLDLTTGLTVDLQFQFNDAGNTATLRTGMISVQKVVDATF